MKSNTPRPSNRVNLIIVCLALVFTIKTIHTRPATSDVVDDQALSSPSNPFENQQDPQYFPHHQQRMNHHQSSKQMDSTMQVHKISPVSSNNNNITCNDGSPIGYYKRLNSHSKSWIIYLQGGGFCGSEESCQQRWQRSPQLMSSNYWPRTKIVDGILSSEPKENPYLWNANHIYVPYCSSDSWTGLNTATSASQRYQTSLSPDETTIGSSTFAFMGSKILERVLDSLYEDLPRESSLYEAKSILLAGDSAGATGVILNLDKVNDIIERRASLLKANCSTDCESLQSPVLRGLADSGWFLDNEPYDFGKSELQPNQASVAAEQESLRQADDLDRYRNTPLQSIKQAMLLWNGQVPEACAANHPTEPWRCYFGYRAYQTLKTPLFVVQWLYDEAQLMVDNIARPDTSGQWNYVNKVVNEMRVSLENVTALFAPSCFSHSLVVRKSWNQININGFKLPHVLNSWEEQSLLDTTSAIASGRPTKTDGSTLSINNNVNNNYQIPDFRQQQQQTSVIYPQLGASPSLSVLNRPTFETLLGEHSGESSVGSFNIAPVNTRETDKTQSSTNQELRHSSQKSNPSNSSPSGRTRNRKRKRNNQQQRSKQARQRLNPVTETYLTPMETTAQQVSNTKESNDLSSVNPVQDILPFIDRSVTPTNLLLGRISRDATSLSVSNGRLGRSTIVDDATLMLSNNVPDDNYANQMTSLSTSTSLDSRKADSSRWPWTSGDSSSFTGTTFNGAFISLPSKVYPNSDQRFRLIDSCGWPQCNRDCPVLESDFR